MILTNVTSVSQSEVLCLDCLRYHLQHFQKNTFEIGKYNILVGLSASHDKEGSVAPTVCGGVHDTAEREGVPRVLLHLPQDLPPTVCLHPSHPARRPHHQVSHTPALHFLTLQLLKHKAWNICIILHYLLYVIQIHIHSLWY